MQSPWQKLPKSAACCLGFSLEKGDSPTACPALPSTHRRSSKGSRRFENACRKVLGGRVGHSVGKSVCGAGALRPSPTWGPRAPDSEGPRAGPVPPGHTERRPHTPSFRKWSACVVTKPVPCLHSCQWSGRQSIMGRTTNSASENKGPHVVWGSQVLKRTCPSSILSPHDTFKSNPALFPYEFS